jgi:endonuclease YncB( thermonuclease family)
MTKPSLTLGLITGAALSAAFALWEPGIRVVDGDTVDHGYWRWRVAGIDTPETRQAHCAEEKALDRRATERLRTLTRGPGVVVRPYHGKDKYGRRLASLWRGDVNLGDVLVDEGLAHRYSGRTKRASWCPNAKRPPAVGSGGGEPTARVRSDHAGAGKAENAGGTRPGDSN